MKNYKTRVAVIGSLCCVFFLFHLEAAVYTYSATIDMGTPSTISEAPGGVWEYTWQISGAPTFGVQAGDTVQGTISFAGNEALQYLGPVTNAEIELTLTDPTAGPLSNQSTTTLNGITGSLTGTNVTSTSSASQGNLFIAGIGSISTPTAVSFTGFSYSATVNSGSGQYTPSVITAYTTNDVPGAIAVIPEPSVAGLIGIGLIILLLRRRTASDNSTRLARQRIPSR